MAQLRILFADDHEEVRQSLARLLESEFDVVATVADGQALVEAAEALTPDVVVADISMPIVDGIEAVRRLRRGKSVPEVVFVTVHRDAAVVDEALSTGARGYVLKSRAAEDLVAAIREVHQGRTYVSPILRDRRP